MINWKYKKPYTETYEIELRQTNPTTSNSSPAHTDTYEDCITKKGRGKNKIYDPIIEKINLNEALDYIKNYDSVKWTRADTRKTNEGKKRFYICHKSCPKRIFILLNAENEFVSIYASNDDLNT